MIFPAIRHHEMKSNVPYKCIKAPKCHSDWVGSIRFNWPKSTTARYTRSTSGEYFYRIRKELKLSKKTLTDKLGTYFAKSINPTMINDWENKDKVPSDKIIMALGCLINIYGFTEILINLAEMDRKDKHMK